MRLKESYDLNRRALIILLSVLLLVTQAAAQYEVKDIRNFMRVNSDFCTGGQPRLEHLEKLKAEGVKAIINLRTPGEHRAAEEEARAKELGLKYFNIPVVYTDPKDEQVAEFLRLTDGASNRPAFVHCTAAIRVGAFWLIRRVVRDGWTFQDAEAEARKVGLVNAPHLIEFATEYIKKHGTPKQAQSAQSQSSQATPVLEGLDPVMLVRGKEVQGELNITVTRGHFQYLFASAENKAAFEKDPARYEIQLGGACARMGAPVTGNPDLFAVHKERIYIFGSPDCKKTFEGAPEKYTESEEAKGPAATPDAIKKGQALIEKAVSAMGGAARLDALASYQEHRKAMQRRQSGDVEIKYLTTVVFPHNLRQEMITPDYGQVIVITPADAFGFSPAANRPARTLPGVMRDEWERQLTRNPLVILKNRKGANFKAVAAGADKIGETQVEQVAVEAGSIKVKLGIDPSSGRVVALSYRGRGPGGVIGQVTRIYSDFRAVDGLTLPFKIEGAFNGSGDPQQSTTIDSITINGQIAPTAFEKPKVATAQ